MKLGIDTFDCDHGKSGQGSYVLSLVRNIPQCDDLEFELFGEEHDRYVYTKDNPIERYTMPDEVAEYAKLLVSDLGNTVVGDTLYMSGGRGIIDKR